MPKNAARFWTSNERIQSHALPPATRTTSHRPVPVPPKNTVPPPSQPTADPLRTSAPSSNHRVHHSSGAGTTERSASSSASTTSTQKPAINRPPILSSQQLHHEFFTISSSSGSLSGADASLQEALHFRPLGQPEVPFAASADSPSSAADGLTNGLGQLNAVVDCQHPDQIAGNGSAATASTMKGVSLREFEAQRRMVEEQNNHKKQMLYKVIEQQYVECSYRLAMSNSRAYCIIGCFSCS